MTESRIVNSDCREALAAMPTASIHAIVTDPPYALTAGKKGGTGPASENLNSPAGRARISTGFMGKVWDNGDTAFDPAFWREALRVLKPGGHVLAFGGTRTYHRLACAVEDGGFEIRDQIGWLYGSGFPKSSNQDGEWAGWGTALKPAWEPIVVARKPLEGTVPQNLMLHGTGAINIDGCRVGDFVNTTPPGTDRYNAANFRHGYRPSAYGRDGEASAERRYTENGATNFVATPGPRGGDPAGRWPANIIHDGSDEVISCFPVTSSGKPGVKRGGNTGAAYGAESRPPGTLMTGFGDSGSAARFFYCAKASRADRNDGLADFEKRPLLWSAGTKNPGSFQSEVAEKAAQNPHPTVKPTDLMRYLCRLVTPPGGTVLDPFAGSGSTGRGAALEGFNFIGVELDKFYSEIARARINAVLGVFG